ncbi:MAG TPA: AAA family ATPase [Steroidobacteraceae bacterium]|jgi:general secretion pathway protein A
MYLSFFGLAEKPFAITPDPRYLYLSARHADALAHLVYGINEAGGFIQLTGEVGTGKTTTIRSLLARAPKNAEIALILNPRLSPGEFLLALCEELGLGPDDNAAGSSKELVDLLNRYLLRAHAQGRRVVLIVDEAQNLAPEVLEHVRLLTNLETETQKLLQIILIGQPELRRLLAREDLRQLAQRITGRYHLDPLSRQETAAYVRHRMRVAGATAEVFTRGALREIYHVSHGIPRVINIICDRALLGAYTQDLHQVPGALIRRAGAEVFDQEVSPRWMPLMVGALALAVLAGSALLLWRYASGRLIIGHRAVVASAPVSTPKLAATPPAGASASSSGALANAVPASSAVAPLVVPSGAAPSTGATNGPAAVAPMGAPPLPTLGSLLMASRSSTDTDTAFTQLLGLWQANYSPGKIDGCTQALTQGLRCLMQRGSLAELRMLNRPAILMLSDDAGTSGQVVLRALGEGTAQIQLGSQTATISLADLTRYWFGDFVLLWRPSARDVRDLSAGMRGAPVRQLREQLTRWSGGGGGGASGNDEYDGSLVQLVEQFQRANRLTVDGIAGIETQVALDAALAPPDSPLLQQQATRQASTRGG